MEKTIYETQPDSISETSVWVEDFARTYAGPIMIGALGIGSTFLALVESKYYTTLFDSSLFGWLATIFIMLLILGGMLVNVTSYSINNKWLGTAGLCFTFIYTIYNVWIAADNIALIYNPAKAEHYAVFIKAVNVGRSLIELMFIGTVMKRHGK